MSRASRTTFAVVSMGLALGAVSQPARAASNLVVSIVTCAGNNFGGKTTTATIRNTGNAASPATTIQVGSKCSTQSQYRTFNVPAIPAGLASGPYVYASNLNCCCWAKVALNSASATYCALADEPLGVEPSTWGAAKTLYR